MGLNYDLGDKPENLRRMNHFEKFNEANRKLFWEKINARFFKYYVRILRKDWR